MNHTNFPYQSIDWAAIPRSEHKGESGTSYWRTLQLPGLRIRIVDYSPGYLADHWCRKGHIVHCLEGEFVNEQQDGAKTIMSKGMTYVVSDELSSHRSRTGSGATLLIVDGDFLKNV
ncbi:MAG: DHCW motif cupin fold protein [Chrysiogenales bacterium]